MFPTPLQSLAEVYCCTKGTLWRKYSLHDCSAFCVSFTVGQISVSFREILSKSGVVCSLRIDIMHRWLDHLHPPGIWLLWNVGTYYDTTRCYVSVTVYLTFAAWELRIFYSSAKKIDKLFWFWRNNIEPSSEHSDVPLCLHNIPCVRKVAVHLGYGTVWFQVCIDARGHLFQNFFKCTANFRTQIRRKCLRIKLNGFRPV
jgi:hypothetical protein